MSVSDYEADVDWLTDEVGDVSEYIERAYEENLTLEDRQGIKRALSAAIGGMDTQFATKKAKLDEARTECFKYPEAEGRALWSELNAEYRAWHSRATGFKRVLINANRRNTDALKALNVARTGEQRSMVVREVYAQQVLRRIVTEWPDSPAADLVRAYWDGIDSVILTVTEGS